MKGLFCGVCKARNNEEFRAVLRKRELRMWFLFAVGLLTAALGLACWFVFGEQTDDYRVGLITGFGVGLGLGAVVAVWKIRKIMSNEERLKEERLKETDEREIEVNNQALQATAKLLLLVLYILMIVGAMFMEELLGVCWFLIAVFLLSYTLFHKHYERKL